MSFDKNSQYRAYHMASQTVRKTRQIVMLYDGAIRFMQQAKTAIIEKRIEDKFNLLNKASDIVISLQGCLDFEHGGDIARILYDYYSSLDARILNIHRSNNLDLAESVIANLKEMREAWNQIDETTHQLDSAATDYPSTDPVSGGPTSPAGMGTHTGNGGSGFSTAPHALVPQGLELMHVSA